MNQKTGFKLSTRDIVILGLLISLKIVLSRVASIQLGIVRITFGFIATGITAYMYGPWIGLMTGALTDVLGFFMFPQAFAYFPGYTITAALSGFIYGYFLYNKPIKLKNIVIANALVCIFCNIILNTVWTSVLQGKAFWVILPPRILKNVLAIPLESLILYGMFKYLVVHLRNMRLKSN